MNYNGLTIIELTLAAAAFGVVAKAAAAKPPTWGSRLFVSAGAAIAVGGAAFTGVFWASIRGNKGFDTLGPVLLAFILALVFGASTFLSCLVFSGGPTELKALVRWSVPMAYASAASAAVYALVYGW
jgi:hypothetical protein